MDGSFNNLSGSSAQLPSLYSHDSSLQTPISLPPLPNGYTAYSSPPHTPSRRIQPESSDSADFNLSYSANRPPSRASSFGSVGTGISHPPRTASKRTKVIDMGYNEVIERFARIESWASSTEPNIQNHPLDGLRGYKCDHPGCNAPSFQTQYLLHSHKNVHSQTRPHFCPVSGCPRAEGGKGFKRKNEMIRHGLVHTHPGYVCPFCPDREHKYPRPDNLQRHVRVHHVDKDKDDPQLREVLEQKPKGNPRRRRRDVDTW